MTSNGYEKFFKQAKKQAPPGKPVRRPTPQKKSTASDQVLKQLIAQKMQDKKQAQKRKRAKFPLASALVLTAIIILTTAYFVIPNSFEFISKHIDIGFLGSAEAASETAGTAAVKDPNTAEKSAATTAQGAAKTAATAAKDKDGKIVDTRGWTPEEMSFFNKLNERKVELDNREAELTKLDEELQRQKVELDKKLEQLEKMRADISGVLKSRVELDQEKVNKLVQVYSGMKAPQAAKLIETINEDLAVEVLDKMKKKSAAEILNSMDPKRAQRLSEILAGYIRQPAAEAPKEN
jgi:flagellar motility protein MotE (MotC chaperone)